MGQSGSALNKRGALGCDADRPQSTLASIQRQRRRSFSVLCFSCPARLRRRQKGGSQGRPIKPATTKTIAAKPAKAAAKPKKSAATAKPKKTAATAAGTKRRAPEEKVVAKPKKSPAAKPPAWYRISRAASVMVIQDGSYFYELLGALWNVLSCCCNF
ncbi:hypothetical protein PVAP13_5NG347300 [Panicum virgatum]|uniref:Uncharacterized protein n=1 Tax=Panicum virgatum TaxID=38727 RepID=A0A8T0RVU8_PANVG|nr:hypothetical protein PVAP13_5NG347300 [Panicum virgatum]